MVAIAATGTVMSSAFDAEDALPFLQRDLSRLAVESSSLKDTGAILSEQLQAASNTGFAIVHKYPSDDTFGRINFD